MFTRGHLCLPLFTFACLRIFTYLYLCLPMFTHEYSCLPKFASLLVFIYVYLCLPMFTRVYLCLIMIDNLPYKMIYWQGINIGDWRFFRKFANIKSTNVNSLP